MESKLCKTFPSPCNFSLQTIDTSLSTTLNAETSPQGQERNAKHCVTIAQQLPVPEVKKQALFFQLFFFVILQ